MNKNFILGSGIIGRIAKDINPSYNMVPYGKSRFYNVTPPLAENYISTSTGTDEYMERYGLSNQLYSRGFSMNGDIIRKVDSNIASLLVEKIHNTDSQLMSLLYSTKNVFSVYNITAAQLYGRLGSVVSDCGVKINKIDCESRIIHSDSGSYDYEHIISTIPLNILAKLIGTSNKYEAKEVFVYHITSRSLDFEGCNELMVIDDAIDFYRVINIAPGNYVFYSHHPINNPYQYFSFFMDEFKVVNTTSIPDYTPVGDVPKLGHYDECGITCIGSLARWDDFYDIGTSISKLMKL